MCAVFPTSLHGIVFFFMTSKNILNEIKAKIVKVRRHIVKVITAIHKINSHDKKTSTTEATSKKPSSFWVDRLIFLASIVAVAVAVIVIIAGGGGGDGSATIVALRFTIVSI